MEARLEKDSPNNSCDYLWVSLDDHSFSSLNQGMPLRVAFAVDNQEHLPWNRRKCMVVTIGKGLDFAKHRVNKDSAFLKGLVDKTYLLDYINRMKQKLVQMAMQELEVFDDTLRLNCQDGAESAIAIEVMDKKEASRSLAVVKDLPGPERAQEPKEYFRTKQAAAMLKISPGSLLSLAKKGLIPGEQDDLGWYFPKDYIEVLVENKPEFLVKVWNSRQSIKMNGGVPKELTFGQERYIHIRSAEGLLNLSCTTIERYVKAGLIKNKRVPGSAYYLSFRHIEKLKANPPAWLKKSWSYFNSQRQE